MLVGIRVSRVVALSIMASSCGRIGYDQMAALDGLGRRAPLQSGGGSPAPDSGNPVDGAGAVNASGGALGGGGAGGGGGTAGNGGSSGTGGSAVPDATDAGGGASNSGGSLGAGGTSAADGAAGGGATGNGGAVAGDGGIIGCADGQREGFLDVTTYPDIAACDGGFQVPGVVGLTGPACGRAAGDDGSLPDGSGCNAEDLCAAGFHLCASATEVGTKSITGCVGAVVGTASVFYLTEQSGGGQQKCGPGTNDVFGCGNVGYRVSSGCAPLDSASGDVCSALVAPWSCGTDLTAEALHVVKPGPTAGGVLCCKD